MLLMAVAGLMAVAAVVLAVLLAAQPDVPRTLPALPALAFLYLQLLRAVAERKQPPTDLKGKPIKVQVTAPVAFDASRYAAFLRLVGYKDVPAQVPLSYPFVEAFRLSMLAMAHKDFPFPVLGAVLARNSSTMARPLALDERLTYSTEVDPDYVRNDKGDYEIAINTTARDAQGKEVWLNSLTVIVINPKRQRGGSAKPAAAAAAAAAQAGAQRTLLAQLPVPANAGRAFGGLSGDRNPIHLYAATSQLFGFKRPIAHAMYLVSRLEAQLASAGYVPATSHPLTLRTEFKRPTMLPAQLQAVVDGSAQAGKLPVGCAVLTQDGHKEVIVGTLAAS